MSLPSYILYVAKHSSRPLCKNCGNAFTPYRPWQEFCCPPCRSQHYERYVRHPFSKALRELEDDREEEQDDETEGEKNRGG